MNDKFDYELFFELTPDLLCIAGYDGYFKKVNQAVAEVLGYTLEELYSKPINEFIHPEDRVNTAQVRELLHQSRPLLNFENRYLKKSGEIIWLSWTSMPIDSQKLVFAIAKNITHKKELEEHRNSLFSQLSEINQELKQLSFSTSHDLRAPVNNLLSIVDFFDTDRIQDEETLELIKLLRNSGIKLSNTLNNFVDLLKERHFREAKLEHVFLSGTLNSVILSIKTLLHSSKATVSLDFSQVDHVEFNQSYLESIFLNLITNSIKYSKSGVNPEIHLYSQFRNGKVEVLVQDNGLGMDIEKVGERIFRMNQSFHGNPESKGIGLYLVYHHVTSLGGRIEVESQVKVGTLFKITFP